MIEMEDDSLDLDYILMSGLLAGVLTSAATVATLLARPVLLEIGRQLPLPNITGGT